MWTYFFVILLNQIFRKYIGFTSNLKFARNYKSVYTINAVFDKGLFQLSGETSCLFTTSIWQGTKKCMMPTALGLPEDMSHRSVLALEVEGFS